MQAQLEMCRTIRVLESLKTDPGEKEKEVTKAIQKSVHNGVKITIIKSGRINRLQFLQNLVNNMRQRLFKDHENSTMLEEI